MPSALQVPVAQFGVAKTFPCSTFPYSFPGSWVDHCPEKNVESLCVSGIDSLMCWPPGASGRSCALLRPRRPPVRYPPVWAGDTYFYVPRPPRGYLSWWSRAGAMSFDVSRPPRGASNMVVPRRTHVPHRRVSKMVAPSSNHAYVPWHVASHVPWHVPWRVPWRAPLARRAARLLARPLARPLARSVARPPGTPRGASPGTSPGTSPAASLRTFCGASPWQVPRRAP